MPPEQVYDKKYQWEVLIVVMIGMFMAVLDSSIVNVSLPTMMADLGVNVDDIEWVVTGYMLAFAALMPLTGWFRDHIGHKKLYLGALGLFTLGSALCGLAWNLPSLIIARIIQALGGGAMGPTSMAMVSEVFPPQERGKAIGIWGIGIIMGPAIGPTLGGFLTKYYGWRSIFTVNIPVGIIGFILAMALLKQDTPPHSQKRDFDLAGFVALTTFLVAFLLGISKGEREGWGSTYIITCWFLSILGLAGFLVTESLVTDGIVDTKLFRIPVFSSCIIVGAVRSVALFGGIFLLPLFLQNIMGYEPIDSGLILLPSSLVVAVVMPLAGRLGDKIGPRLPSIFGLMLCAYSFYLYRTIDVNTGLWGIIYPTLIRSVGMPLLMSPIMAAAVNSVPKNKVAMASSMLNITQQVGGAIGIAVLTTILSHRTVFHTGAMGSLVDRGSPAMHQAMVNVSSRAHELGFSMANSIRIASMAVGGYVHKMAFVGGFEDTFIFAAFAVGIGMLASFLLPNKPVGHVPQGAQAD